jgi:hypothetical protein
MPVDYTKNHEKLLRLLKENLRGEKFHHSLGVEQTAIELAKLNGADWKKAALRVCCTISQNRWTTLVWRCGTA